MAYQTRFLASRGYEAHVLALHRDAISRREEASADIITLAGYPWQKLATVIRYLSAHRSRLHHVELYPGGRLAAAYGIAARLMRVPVLVVERGDLWYALNRSYGRAMRLSIYLCYLVASRIWYRELYAEPFFRRLRVLGKATLLPNAVPIGTEPTGPRDIDIVWANRLTAQRHPEWFAAAVANLAAERHIVVEMVGFLPDTHSDEVGPAQDYVRAKWRGLANCSVRDFTDPAPYLARSKWFVLPADVVYCNFALLEAMAAGVVAVVSRTPGAELLINDGVNGYLADHSARGLEDALRRALDTPHDRWTDMSAAARRFVAEQHSIDAWGERLLGEYGRLR